MTVALRPEQKPVHLTEVKGTKEKAAFFFFFLNDTYFIASLYWLERQTYSGYKYKNNRILTNNTLLLQYRIISGGWSYNTTLNNSLRMDLTQSIGD